MKKLSKATQITAISHHEIRGPIEGLVAELSSRDGYLTKALTYGQVVNGLILLLLDKPREQQLKICNQAIDRLETWSIGRDSVVQDDKGFPPTVLPDLKRQEQRPRKK